MVGTMGGRTAVANNDQIVAGIAQGVYEAVRDAIGDGNQAVAMEKAVKGMLPHNTIGANSIKRLKVYAGAEHNHAAQKPEALAE